jgi:hypothetical protein
MSLTQPLPSSPAPVVGKHPVPSQLAVIAPLEIDGPITYQTLLEYLDAAPIPYQLWLLTQVATTPETAPTVGTAANAVNKSGTDQWAYSPEFSPVNGIDATPVAWPSTAAPRVITIQYEGLAINQAINWAIRQAHGDMILVLDSGLSGLMQLRQALDEISISMPAAGHETVAASPVATIPAEVSTAEDIAELPVPGAFNRRLVERLEQWGAALQRQASLAKERRDFRPADIQPAVAESIVEANHENTISRVDGQSHIQPAKKLPKFITRFHEFI